MISDVPDIREFLGASGYTIEGKSTGVRLRAARERNGQSEALIVWAPLLANPPVGRDQVLAELAAAGSSDPGAERIVILPNLLSFRADFQTAVKKAGGEIRAYAQFFDDPFVPKGLGLGTGGDEAEEASELSRSLIKPERLDADILQAILRPNHRKRREFLDRPPERVPQPYFVGQGTTPTGDRRPDGHDLLQHLIARLNQPAAGPEVFMIVAPAGAGKTYLLEALFTYLYEGFMLAKSKQQLGTRPIPVLPESLLRAASYSSRELFNAVAETEGAGALSREALDFFVCRGKTTLMIDGLDEFFAEQDDFFAEINARYLDEHSKARIFIVLRDSLLSTSPNVRKLVADLSHQPFVTLAIYQLALWNREDAKRTMAWLRLEKRRPDAGEADTARVRHFLAQLRAFPVMDDLARLPYYCERLLEFYGANAQVGDEVEIPGANLPGDEYELLDYALEKLMRREWEKHHHVRDGTLVPEMIFVEGWQSLLLAFGRFSVPSGGARNQIEEGYAPIGEAALKIKLEEAAYIYRHRAVAADGTAGGGGLTTRLLTALYKRTRSWATNSEEREKGERILRQYPLFSEGAAGSVDFTHEIMADYLAARHALRLLRENPTRFCDVVRGAKSDDAPVFLGYLRREFANDRTLAEAVGKAAALGDAPCRSYAQRLLA